MKQYRFEDKELAEDVYLIWLKHRNAWPDLVLAFDDLDLGIKTKLANIATDLKTLFKDVLDEGK